MLYRTPFLDGFSIPDSPLFEEWTLVIREHYHRLALDALHRLAELGSSKASASWHFSTRGSSDNWTPGRRPDPTSDGQPGVPGPAGGPLGEYEICRRVLRSRARGRAIGAD